MRYLYLLAPPPHHILPSKRMPRQHKLKLVSLLFAGSSASFSANMVPVMAPHNIIIIIIIVTYVYCCTLSANNSQKINILRNHNNLSSFLLRFSCRQITTEGSEELLYNSQCVWMSLRSFCLSNNNINRKAKTVLQWKATRKLDD